MRDLGAEDRVHLVDDLPGLGAPVPGDGLSHYVELIWSEDGSTVLVSWAELDPAANGNQILLAVAEDGHTMLQQDTGPRLTVPGDASGARYDYGVQVVSVFRAP